MRWLIGVLLLLLLGLQYRLWVGPGSFAEVARLEHRIEVAAGDNRRLARRNQRLEEEVSSLKRGLSAVEARARTELGMIRRGETFYLMIEPAPSP